MIKNGKLLLLSKDIMVLPPRYRMGMLFEQGKHWSQEDMAALHVLTEGHADIDKASPILARPQPSIARKATELGCLLPSNWKVAIGKVPGGRDWRTVTKIIDLNYPYILESENNDNKLTLLVSNLVPRGLPGEMRDDVCQDILLAVLENQITIDQIKDAIPSFIKATRKRYSLPWNYQNIDYPIFEDGGTKYGDRIHSDVSLYGNPHE